MAEREVRERRRHAQRKRDCSQQDGRRPETRERAPATVEQEQGGEEDDELGLVEQAAQHPTGDAVASAPQEHVHRGKDEQRQQAVLPIADGRPDRDEGQHPWRRADPIDEPERPHQHQDAERAPERECREVGQRGERYEEQREEGRVDQAVTPGPLAGQPVLDPLLQIGIVEVVGLVRGDDPAGGVEQHEVAALHVARSIVEARAGSERDEPGDPDRGTDGSAEKDAVPSAPGAQETAEGGEGRAHGPRVMVGAARASQRAPAC